MAEKLKLEDLQSPLLERHKRDDRFQRVGVIGLGVMGQGIAETVASAGIEVIAVEKRIPTNEELVIALNTKEIVRKMKEVGV